MEFPWERDAILVRACAIVTAMLRPDRSTFFTLSSAGFDAADYQSLYDEICREQSKSLTFAGGPGHEILHMLLDEKVILPVAGVIGKSVWDLVVDRAKNWLARRPEDRKVEILGPDGTVVSLVKKGKEISTTTGAGRP